jgi:hypothetical protein
MSRWGPMGAGRWGPMGAGRWGPMGVGRWGPMGVGQVGSDGGWAGGVRWGWACLREEVGEDEGVAWLVAFESARSEDLERWVYVVSCQGLRDAMGGDEMR